MIQNPVIPKAADCNAVKIEINNPTVKNVSCDENHRHNTAQMPAYYYGYPQASIYSNDAMQIPSYTYMPQMPTIPSRIENRHAIAESKTIQSSTMALPQANMNDRIISKKETIHEIKENPTPAGYVTIPVYPKVKTVDVAQVQTIPEPVVASTPDEKKNVTSKTTIIEEKTITEQNNDTLETTEPKTKNITETKTVVSNDIVDQQPQVVTTEIKTSEVTDPQPQITTTETKTVITSDAVNSQPQITTTETKTITNTVTASTTEAQEVKKPDIVAPENIVPQINIDEYCNKLSTNDFEAQFETMKEIKDLVQKYPQDLTATLLVDKKIFAKLDDILQKDTTDLAGPSKEQLDARAKIASGKKVSDEEIDLAESLSPREYAEHNKSIAMYTMASLDKLLVTVLKDEDKFELPLIDLPYANTIADEVKNNPNPIVRASAIESLSWIQQAEYKDDLKSIFQMAAKDPDAYVAQTAKEALDKLNTI